MPKEGTKGPGQPDDPFRAVPIPPSMPRPGDTFAGRYEIERLAGRGGMGEVYVAIQAPLNRRVAVKILKPPANEADDPNFHQRFLREAEAAASLQHPNTITVFDFGQTDDGQLYIVMEYLQGNDLRAAIAHQGVFPVRRAIHVAKQVCKSLREAHGEGMVHRDLKPANVVLIERDDDPDFVKVLDFGLVKFRGEEELTLAGKFLGSPRYTAPEALDRNAEVDHRADIYAVGILLYAMITGQPPFDGDPLQVLNAHMHETPQPMYQANPAAKTTKPIEDLVARCLAKDPSERFASMMALLRALRQVGAYLGDEETETLDVDGVSVSDMMAPDPDTSSSLRVSRDQIELATPVELGEPGRAAKPLILVGALVLVLAGVALWLRDPGPTVAPSEPASITVSEDVQIQLVVRGVEGAVEVKSGDAWVGVGEGAIDRLVPVADGTETVRLRVAVEGGWAEHALPIVDGGVRLELAAPEEAAPEPVEAAATVATPVAAPAATPKSARPKASPKPVQTRPKPKPTAKPAAEPTPDLPSGYKNNPY